MIALGEIPDFLSAQSCYYLSRKFPVSTPVTFMCGLESCKSLPINWPDHIHGPFQHGCFWTRNLSFYLRVKKGTASKRHRCRGLIAGPWLEDNLPMRGGVVCGGDYATTLKLKTQNSEVLIVPEGTIPDVALDKRSFRMLI